VEQGLAVEGLNGINGCRKDAVHAVKDVPLHIGVGGIFGLVGETGPVADEIDNPQHACTRKLLSAVPLF
jgi:ABC-type oligopeptide transport system ATPase subunit